MEKFITRIGGVKEVYDRQRIEETISLVYLYNKQPELFNDLKTKETMLTKLETLSFHLTVADLIDIQFKTNTVEENLFSESDTVLIEDIKKEIKEVLGKDETGLDTTYEKLNEEFEKIHLSNSNFFKTIMQVLHSEFTENSNANVDENSFGGRKFRASGELQKFIALEMMISPKIKRRYLENEMYIHDLDSYSIGQHNCMFVDLEDVLLRGFVTRNGDVRTAGGIETAYQLVAVIFQIQSQAQFGGVGTPAFDSQLAPFVANSFRKLFKKEIEKHNRYSPNKIYVPEKLMKLTNDIDSVDTRDVKVEGTRIKFLPKFLRTAIVEALYREIYIEARNELIEVLKQSSEALVHNLNTLESRPGSQLPFTSVNVGYDTTPEGRLVTQYLLEALMDGIGKYHKTSIFPIVIFKHKKGINAYEGEPNYDLKQLAIKCLSKRIYPNFVNCDVDYFEQDGTNNGVMATMGCRTLMSSDRHAPEGSTDRSGRGNLAPATIILPELGIKYGICTGERSKPDLQGFWKEFFELIEDQKDHLLERFELMCKQPLSAAPFMYKNRIWKGTDEEYAECERTQSLYPLLRHGSLAMGYLGVSEMCKALFGKTHDEDQEVLEFAIAVVRNIHRKAKEYSEEYDLNFGCYATPAESLCHTAIKRSQKKHGLIEGVTDKDYYTNSHHVDVTHKVSIEEKIQIERHFNKFATAGCITYVELESNVLQNPKAVESIINYAMDNDIVYMAINFPINTCLGCGFSEGEIDVCPVCGSTNIEKLGRVTGYLTSDYRNFNKGKQEEFLARTKHKTELVYL